MSCMRHKALLLQCVVLFLLALDASGVRAGMLQGRNIVNDPATGSVTGTWTLVDASGRTLAGGGW
ncbi:MAG: hypothetical protein M3X11_13705, partial [Acidobacteriota bacterium]|nr:hypothetical protein [Acidobacteriota bacterium]